MARSCLQTGLSVNRGAIILWRAGVKTLARASGFTTQGLSPCAWRAVSMRTGLPVR